MGDEQSVNSKEVPTGVKVIAVLYYIVAGLLAISGILSLVGAGAMSSITNKIPLFEILGALGSGLFIIIAIIFIGLGVLEFFIARGLWKAKSWARILVIIFAAIGALFAIVSLVQGNIFSGLFNLLINGLIGGYLWFNNNVKEAFA